MEKILFLNGNNKKHAPVYFIRSNKELLRKFSEFLTDAKDQLYKRETEDPDVGLKYIEDNVDKINIPYVMQYATPRLKALVEVGLDEGLSKSSVIDLLVDNTSLPEAVGSGTSENSLLRVPVGEYEVDLTKIPGRINAKAYDSLVVEFIERINEFDPQAATKILDRNPIDDDLVYFANAPVDHWEVTVDEDGFKNQLLSLIDVDEEILEKQIPGVA